MTKRLTVNVGLHVEGDESFILLLHDLIANKKNINFLPDRSIWDYDPETTFLTANVTDAD